MPITFYELPQGTPSVFAGPSSTAYCTPSDVASLNKTRSQAWGLTGQPNLTDVSGYIVMSAGQIDAILTNKGYSVPVNTASNPELEGLLCYINSTGAAWMVEVASPDSPNVDRTKAAFDAAMEMLASAQFTLNAPIDATRAQVRAPFITFQPNGETYDPANADRSGIPGDGLAIGTCRNNPRNPYFSRSMRF